MTTIKYPGKHDVMLGRGGESNYHSGNIAFRHMVQKYKERFRLGSRNEKNKVIEEVVREWRDQDPVGRFVAKKKTGTGEVVWYDVGNELAKKRAAKSLAEWTPNKPFESKSGKRSPGEERKKRSRSTSTNGSTSSDSGQDQPPAKRPSRTSSASPVSSFTVVNMALLDRQEQPSNVQLSVQDIALGPLPLNPQLDNDIVSAAAWATPQDVISSSSNTSPSQQLNINTMNVLPIERIRVALPTAAELAFSAFSDDDKSYHSNSSRESQHSNGLLVPKTDLSDLFRSRNTESAQGYSLWGGSQPNWMN